MKLTSFVRFVLGLPKTLIFGYSGCDEYPRRMVTSILMIVGGAWGFGISSWFLAWFLLGVVWWGLALFQDYFTGTGGTG